MSAPKGGETIFAEALRLSQEERGAYIAQATAGNPELRQELESLLVNYQGGSFLEQPAAPELRPPPGASSATEKPGDMIGRYKLLQEVGRGGCGVVHMAEQVEPVRRRVALKIIKLGMDTKSVIARFEAERQALALMDHPNIAKVLDAGATETGRPYFVMELVRGTKITDFCDERRLSTRERLDLFILVCHAIQHAHQKGIIHRDIKPSNILVSEDDGAIVPKVIDFGIAKATGGQLLTEKTVFTAFEQFIGTPAYMSPEQALITNADIDTRSDVYALGVLLYELLTGNTPFESKALLRIGLEEMCRAIRELEPPRPSTRLSTLPSQELSTAAQRRGLDAPKLISQVRGDLDWIIMKALEKDRARRYETANAVAADVQRHLNDEPVIACPPGKLYRFRKTLRRNKLSFTVAGAVAASLLIGLTGSAILFFRERAARERANEQTAIAKAVNDFLQYDLLMQADSHEQANSGFVPDPNLTVRQALERAAERIGDRFKGQPMQECAVRNQIGLALVGLGEPERAILHLQRALELASPGTGRHSLIVMQNLGYAYLRAGKLQEARPILEKALKLFEAKFGAEDPVVVNTMQNLAIVDAQTGNLEGAIPLFEKILEVERTRPSPKEERQLRATANLANAYRLVGKLETALPLYEEVFQREDAKQGRSHPKTQESMHNLAVAYVEAGKFDQSLLLFEDVLTLREATLGPGHPHTLQSISALAASYLAAGRTDEAVSSVRERILRSERPPLAAAAPGGRALPDFVHMLLEQHRWSTAEELLREYMRLWVKPEFDDWNIHNARSQLGGALLGQGKLDEAQGLVVAGYYGLSKQAITQNLVGNYVRDDLRAAMDRLQTLHDLCRDHPDSPRWKAEIERVRRINDPGAIRDWLILGPIPLDPDKSPSGGLQQEQLNSERSARPAPEDKVSLSSGDLAWQEHHLKDYVMDLNRLFGKETLRSLAYAVCYVRVAAPQKNLLLKVGSDDQARVYLNGKQVYENLRVRGHYPDEDTVSDVELRAGMNVVVFKIVTGYGGWGGSLRFTDKDDQPVPGIEITLDPD